MYNIKTGTYPPIIIPKTKTIFFNTVEQDGQILLWMHESYNVQSLTVSTEQAKQLILTLEQFINNSEGK